MGDTILLVRHGQTIWNTERRWQGHLDSALTPTGIEQARSVARALRSLIPRHAEVAIETSPLGRARQTGEIICSELAMDPAAVVLAPLLMEHDLGEWAGLTIAERDARFPGASEARERDKWNYRVPGGESYAAAQSRASEWLAVPRQAPVTIAVTHEMISRNLQGAYLGLEPVASLARRHRHLEILRFREGLVDVFVGEARADDQPPRGPISGRDVSHAAASDQ